MTRAKKRRLRLPKRTERSIEEAAVAAIEARWPQALVRKLNGQGNRNWPDRLILFPQGYVIFIEFKKPGEKPRPGQEWFLYQLTHLGFDVRVFTSVVDTMNGIARMLEKRGMLI